MTPFIHSIFYVFSFTFVYDLPRRFLHSITLTSFTSCHS